jgi:hypothetical protein
MNLNVLLISVKIHGSSVSIVIGCGLVEHISILGRSWDFFLLTTASRLVLGLTQLPSKWVLGVLFVGIKQRRHEADNLPPTSAEIENMWSYTSTHGVVCN